MTKSQTTTQNRFHEMEAAIRRHQTALQRHATELQQVNERAITTMELCQATSTNILALRDDTTNQLREIRNEAERQATEQRESLASIMAMISQLNNHPLNEQPTHAESQSDTSSNNDDNDEESDESESIASNNMSTDNTHQTRQSQGLLQASPLHKKEKRKNRDRGLRSVRQNLNPKNPPSDQDPSAQYKLNRTPDAGDT